MTEIIGATLLTLAGYATLVALLTTTTYLIPQRAERARQIFQEKPGRAFIVGLVNLLFFGVLAAVLSQGGEAGGLLGLIILLALLGLAIVGLTGLLLLLRRRFYPPHEETNHSLLAVTLRASAILMAGLLAPVVGWFILAPILLITGLGTGIMMMLRNSRSLVKTQQDQG
jgi:MFS family permease